MDRRTMDAQMTCTHFSGCQDVRGRVKTQVLHSGDQLNPARVSCPTTKMKLCNKKDVQISFQSAASGQKCHMYRFESLISNTRSQLMDKEFKFLHTCK